MNTCSNLNCDNTFKPQGAGKLTKRYCSKRCRGKVNEASDTRKASRRAYDATDAAKDAKRAYSDRYRADPKVREATRTQRTNYASKPIVAEARAKYLADPKVKAARVIQQAEYGASVVGRARSSRKSQKRRALKLNAFIEHVDLALLIKQQNDCCSLCGLQFEGTYPNPLSPSLDHTKPLSKGGEHSYANTTAAHLRCNVSKGARLVA